MPSLFSSSAASISFASWLRDNAALLNDGHELHVPIFLARPAALGFTDAGFDASGVARAWTLALRDGRIVVDEYAHGQCIARIERSASVARSVTAALDAVVDVAETGAAIFARGLVEIGARI